MHKKPAFAAMVSAIALAMLTLVGCKEDAAPAATHAPQVGVVTLQAEPFTLTAELPGRTSAYRIAEVRPQVDGIIQKRLFKEGSEVKAGQQLYQIDASVYQSTFKSAQATLASTQSLAERYKDLVADQAVSKQAYDEAQAARLQAEAALERARIDLRYTKVMAPISGRVGRSLVTEGALVSNGQVLAMATIQQLDPIYVDLTQTSAQLLALRKQLASGALKAIDGKAQVRIVLEDGSTYAHPGTLEFVGTSVDTGTGNVVLRAVVPNPDALLLPGTYVRAVLPMAIDDNAILVPQSAVTRNTKGEATVLLVGDDGKVEQRVVQAATALKDQWVISAGLKAGEKLIVQGGSKVGAGDAVQAKDVADGPARAPAADGPAE